MVEIDGVVTWKQLRPSQSITEVLQDPLELRLGPGVDPISPISPLVRASARRRGGVLGSRTGLPPSPRITINDFEAYLREFTEPYAEYQSLAAFSRREKFPHPSASAPSDEQDDAFTLEDIPKVYFDEDFDLVLARELWNPLENLDEDDPFNVSLIGAVRMTLSKFASVVEREMFELLKRKRIQIREALSAVNDLKFLAERSVKATGRVCSSTASTSQNIRDGALRVGFMWKRRQNALELLEIVQKMAQLPTIIEDIDILIEAGDYSTALDALESARRIISQKPMSSIRSIQGYRLHIDQAEQNVIQRLTELFKQMLVQEAEPLEKNDPIDHQNFIPIITEMRRLDQLHILRTLTDEHVRNRVLRVASVVPAGGKTSASKVGDSLALIVEALQSCKQLLQVVHDSSTNPDHDQVNPLHDSKEALLTSLDDILTDFVTRTTSDLTITIQDGIRGVLGFADVMRSTASACESIEATLSTRKGRLASLTSTIIERCRAMLQFMHKYQMESLSKILAREVWAEVRVPPETQSIVDQLRKVGALQRYVRAAEQRDGKEQCVSRESVTALWRETLAGDQEGGDDKEGLMIVSEEFRMVPSGLLLLRGCVLYAVLVTELGEVVSIGGEGVRRCCEYLRMFNETTSRLVLGAGAMKTAGLKSITARHLALASRIVKASSQLFPLILDSCKPFIAIAQLDMVQDQVKKVCQDLESHQDQLISKILLVMLERLDLHRRVLAGLPWESEPDIRRESIPSRPISSLIKETSVLHRILLNLLPRSSLVALFDQIIEAYSVRLNDTFDDILSRTGPVDWAQIRVGADINHIHIKLRGMEAIGSLGNDSSLSSVRHLLEKFSFRASLPDKSDSGGEHHVSISHASDATVAAASNLIDADSSLEEGPGAQDINGRPTSVVSSDTPTDSKDPTP